jgi:hypothetical protein
VLLFLCAWVNERMFNDDNWDVVNESTLLLACRLTIFVFVFPFHNSIRITKGSLDEGRDLFTNDLACTPSSEDLAVFVTSWFVDDDVSSTRRGAAVEKFAVNANANRAA